MVKTEEKLSLPKARHELRKVLVMECGFCNSQEESEDNELVVHFIKQLNEMGWRDISTEDAQGTACPNCVELTKKEEL